MGALVVVVDGEAMEEALAKAFWQRFSAYMEAHKGDLGGFAVSEGLASVHPELRDGRPALIASRKATQRPYANAPNLGTPGAPPSSAPRAGAANGAARQSPAKRKKPGSRPR